MIRGFGTPELVVLLVIIILLFGVGRISKIAKELGAGIRSFREGIQGDKNGPGMEDPNAPHEKKD